MELKDLEVLVTGGAGFIGSNLIDALVQKGNRLIVYDNFDDYYGGKEANLRHHQNNRNVRQIRADILDYDSLVKAAGDVDLVFHLAAQPGVRYSLENPVKTSSVNFMGTVNVLRAVGKSRGRKLVFASSSSVYGNPQYMPIDENHPTNPISVYGITKLAAEKLCLSLGESWGLSVVVVRYFTVYGPRQRPDMAIFRWVAQMIDQKPLTVYGDGEQMRDFTYVEDTVRGTVLAASNMGADGRIFNIGSGTVHKLKDIIRIMQDIIGKNRAEISYEDSKSGDVPATHANIGKARRVLGYTPEVDIKEGIRRFVDWYIRKRATD